MERYYGVLLMRKDNAKSGIFVRGVMRGSLSLACREWKGWRMDWHKVCEDCVLNGDCLFQDNDDVESCGDVRDYGEVKNETK